MTRCARRWLAGATVAALPVAWWLANLGLGFTPKEPLRDVSTLLILAGAEEIVFRGGLQAWLARRPMLQARRFGLSGANVLTSVVFSAAHLWAHPPLLALAVFPVSLLLGASFEQGGRLWLPAALHAWFNVALYAASWLVMAR
ncbi:MAG: JDVT-CTERM system glutamic-type intramembrane protease [Burkholderiaceae bacterium]